MVRSLNVDERMRNGLEEMMKRLLREEAGECKQELRKLRKEVKEE